MVQPIEECKCINPFHRNVILMSLGESIEDREKFIHSFEKEPEKHEMQLRTLKASKKDLEETKGRIKATPECR